MLKIKELRNERNLTLAELSSKLKLSPQVLSRYERGDREPDLNTLCLIADFFGCSVDYLLGREDDFGVVAGNASNAPALTQEETQLLKDFRLLDDISKYKVIGYCHALI